MRQGTVAGEIHCMEGYTYKDYTKEFIFTRENNKVNHSYIGFVGSQLISR
jgi:hypothetical protein